MGYSHLTRFIEDYPGIGDNPILVMALETESSGLSIYESGSLEMLLHMIAVVLENKNPGEYATLEYLSRGTMVRERVTDLLELINNGTLFDSMI